MIRSPTIPVAVGASGVEVMATEFGMTTLGTSRSAGMRSSRALRVKAETCTMASSRPRTRSSNDRIDRNIAPFVGISPLPAHSSACEMLKWATITTGWCTHTSSAARADTGHWAYTTSRPVPWANRSRSARRRKWACPSRYHQTLAGRLTGRITERAAKVGGSNHERDEKGVTTVTGRATDSAY